jgi:DNA segregation ATPase FtsK/SpoIIIE, S-DNA-T family
VRSGRAGLVEADAGEFDLALIDLRLPDRDGVEVCRQLRVPAARLRAGDADRAGSEMDVVVGLEAGAVDYLTKPFRFAELTARVRAHLRHRPRAGPPGPSGYGGRPGARLEGPAGATAVVDLWGWRARIRLARGQTLTDALNRLPAIESSLGTRPGAARIEADPDRADRFTLRVMHTDPHAQAIRWPGPGAATITEPVELGVYEDGTPVRVSLLRRHGLAGGVAGSGKSGILNVILGALTACPDVVLWGIDLKGGMELQPWAPCLRRLATTPTDATGLLTDAVRILNARAAALAERGARVWEPRTDAPALVIIIDEYAELAEEAPAAITAADSIARRGRAVAVTLLAATQRPTQQAMGKGAVRSQMDVRLCLRVRERKDVDLILGQGMLTAGWHAHTLNAPGKFLLSAPGLDTPRRARAYLLTDHDVSAIAARNAPHRPDLDPTSAHALTHPTTPAPADTTAAPDTDNTDPDITLWATLHAAPDEGLSVADLMHATGKGRTWIYDRLLDHARTGQVTQVTRGRWRATTNHEP